MKRKMKLLVFLLIAVLTVLPSTVNANPKDQEKSNSLVYLPILFYTPETNVAVGGLIAYNFYTGDKEEGAFPSTLMPNIIYTLNGQIISEATADLYWGNGNYHFQGRAAYQFFPDKFYGVGNNTSSGDEEDFTKKTFDAEFMITKKFLDIIDIGLQYKLQYNSVSDYDSGGKLINKTITGSGGGWTSGTGVIFSYDSRSNKYYPDRGLFANASYTYYGNNIGSDYRFDHYLFDCRVYESIFRDHIIAVGGTLSVMDGNPPFQLLPALGGQNIMRGYYAGRYRDKNSFVLQTEYRMPLWNRFGLVLFAGIGDVANDLNQFQSDNFKSSFGAGLRYMINKEEKLNIRLDFGFVKGGSGMYITLAEAI